MFEDFMVLDLYNKLSRWLAIWVYYLMVVVFLIGMTINDTFIVTEDQFFIHIPVVLLIVGFVIICKYESHPNVFYPRLTLWINQKYNTFLSQHKAYHFIRLNHFYSLLFAIYIYRLFALIFL